MVARAELKDRGMEESETELQLLLSLPQQRVTQFQQRAKFCQGARDTWIGRQVGTSCAMKMDFIPVLEQTVCD